MFEFIIGVDPNITEGQTENQKKQNEDNLKLQSMKRENEGERSR